MKKIINKLIIGLLILTCICIPLKVKASVNEKGNKSFDDFKKQEETILYDNLSNLVDDQCQKLEGSFQVAIDSIEGESSISLFKTSSDKPSSLPSASTIKVFVAMSTYKMVEDEKVDESIIYDDVYKMLQNSNNESCNRLIDLLGFESINETIFEITKDHKTQLNRKMLHDGDENITSAIDLNKALIALYKGEFLSRENSDKILKAMADNNTTSFTKLLANLPETASGLNKSGELSDRGVQNDIAIIKTDNSTFAISVLSDFPNPTPSSGGIQFDLLQNLGRKTCEEFIKFDNSLRDFASKKISNRNFDKEVSNSTLESNNSSETNKKMNKDNNNLNDKVKDKKSKSSYFYLLILIIIILFALIFKNNKN